jgi:hypothetical protein
MHWINQQDLTKDEIRLLEEVLAFKPSVLKKNALNSLNQINLCVEVSHETLTRTSYAKKSVLEGSIRGLEENIRKYQDELRELGHQLSLIRDAVGWDRDLPEEGIRISGQMRYLEVEVLSPLINKLGEIKNAIATANGDTCEFTTKLMGVFVSPPGPTAPTIVLFMDNMPSSPHDRPAVLVATFVHECFHAWNYMASNRNKRGILEVDEPMVEFSMLSFLKELSLSNATFSGIFDFAYTDVSQKKNAVGETAAYGFGSTLFTRIPESERRQWIYTYSIKNASINPYAQEVLTIRERLNPVYEQQFEDEVYDCFRKVVIGSLRTRSRIGVVTNKHGWKNIVTEDGLLVFDDCIEDIVESSNGKFFFAKEQGRYRLYDSKTYSCVSPEEYAEVREMELEPGRQIRGNRQSIFLIKRFSDGKSNFLCCHDIELAIENRGGDIMMDYALPEWTYCIYEHRDHRSGFSFYLTEKGGTTYTILPWRLRHHNLRHALIEGSEPMLSSKGDMIAVKVFYGILVYSTDGRFIGQYDKIPNTF